MDKQIGFSVSNFVELPIIPIGMKAVQKRDAKGRFISDWDIVPDPDAKPFPKEVGNVYLLNNTFDKMGQGCSLCGPHFIGRCPHVVPSYPSLKALEPSFKPLREAHCCKTCKRCAINDEGTYGYCAEIMRGVDTDDSEYAKAVLRVELDFYCLYWELKE